MFIAFDLANLVPVKRGVKFLPRPRKDETPQSHPISSTKTFGGVGLPLNDSLGSSHRMHTARLVHIKSDHKHLTLITGQ